MPPDIAAAPLASVAGFRLVTQDLPRLRRFYAGVLGFAVLEGEQPIAAAELALLGLRGGGVRQTLALGDQRVAVEQYDPPGRRYPAHGNAAALWFQHLALVVADMAQAYPRIEAATPISTGGPQRLPASAGGVHAVKFRDPDGHPLELLQFPDGARPAAWQGRSGSAGQIGLGIDHSAISVADAGASIAFYRALGLAPGKRTDNHGPAQQNLDHLADVRVKVVPLRPSVATPHLELLGYRVPCGAVGPVVQPNDVAATRIVWHGERDAVLRDPDGHLHQVIAAEGTPA